MPRGISKNPEETKKKLKKALKGKTYFELGREPVSKNTRTMMSIAKKGEKNHRWNGGLEERKRRKKDKYIRKQEILAGRLKPEQCEICGMFGKNSKKGLCFDHDHNTKKFRG